LAGRINVIQDLTITDENISVPLRVRIRLKNGAEHELTLDQVLGHPDKPLSREQHLEKFSSTWRNFALAGRRAPPTYQQATGTGWSTWWMNWKERRQWMN